MKRRQCLTLPSVLALSLLCIRPCGPAHAGPNAAGTLVVHEVGPNPTCDPYVGSPVPTCAEVDNNLNLNSSCPTWKVYAAFPTHSQPRLASVSFGVDCTQTGYLFFHATPTPGAGVSVVTTPDWPYAGSGITMTFDPPRSAPMNELLCFIFASYGYDDPQSGQIWGTVPHPILPSVFLDDSVPPLEDPIAAYGTLGFNVEGYTPCPQTPTPALETRWGRIKARFR
jgi:hypothetical protein